MYVDTTSLAFLPSSTICSFSVNLRFIQIGARDSSSSSQPCPDAPTCPAPAQMNVQAQCSPALCMRMLWA